MTDSTALNLSNQENQKNDLAAANIVANESFQNLEEIAEDFPIDEEQRRFFMQAFKMFKESYFGILNQKNK